MSLLCVLKFHTKGVQCVEVEEGGEEGGGGRGKLVVSGGSDGCLAVWSLY